MSDPAVLIALLALLLSVVAIWMAKDAVYFNVPRSTSDARQID